MLRCWRCGSEFAKKTVLRDSILRARDESRGGPYKLYKCTMCNRECRIEATPKGRLFASPEKEISALDYLFSWIETLTPDDFLMIVQWHRLHADRRGQFFLQDGDDRYMKGSIKGLFSRMFVKEGKRAEPTATNDGERAKLNVDDSLPHPYRILGVTRDATDDEIREAFRSLAKTWHPDKLESDDAKVIEHARKRLQELLEAYEVLKNRRP